MDGCIKMMEEMDQEKKQKKNKYSSTEKIDSFFGSHDLDQLHDHKKYEKNFKETERLIDKVIDNNSSTEDQETMKPSVKIVDGQNKQSQEEQPVSSYEHDDQINIPEFQSFEKEELFEVDHPEKQIAAQKKRHEHKIIKQKEKTKILIGRKQKKDNKEQSSQQKKDTFSFHLPKLNIKLSGTKKKSKKDTNPVEQQVEDKVKQVKNEQISPSSIETKIEATNGRIHGLTQVNQTNNEAPPVKQQEKEERKQSKTLSNSNKKSFSLFKRKKTRKPSKVPATKQPSQQSEEREIPKKIDTEKMQFLSSDEIDEEVIHLLKITDDLLGKLPDDVIEEFSQSDDFILYEKVMKKYNIIE